VSRYSRQELFSGIGPAGQARIRESRVLLVGCGALGSVLAETMTRAGVGSLTLVDRDYVEETNLQRQSLFDEDDVARGLPKAVAAEAKLRRINSEVRLHALVADVDAETAPALIRDADLVLDGTDNFETRFLVNDLCVQTGTPWVYGACVASYGLALLVRPQVTPCLRCVLEEMPPPGSGPTCDTAGVVAPIVHVVAGVQSGEALKLLAGRTEDLLRGIVTVDLWAGIFDVVDLSRRRPSCPACTEGRLDYVRPGEGAAVLCGRDAVQLSAPHGARVDLEALADRLSRVGRVSSNEYLVRFSAKDADMVVFADGRVMVRGVRDTSKARSLYAKYVG
jgi:molybdopterin/thiamine biosynthesis adenylyltransferase